MYKFALIIGLNFCLSAANFADAQQVNNAEIKQLIEAFKADARGPYKDIRWFCKDGTVRDPKDPCPKEIGPGVQHARYKESVIKLGKKNHLFFGQILSYTDKIEFWDAAENHSRLKQYQLEKYLKLNDDGWILKKAQFYRGAYQAEDEAAWGVAFFKWLLTKDDVIEKNYYLVRSALNDIPHKGDNNTAQLMRSLSKSISDELPAFMNLRVKIHGQPEEADIEKVKEFKQEKSSTLSPKLNGKLDELIVAMTNFYIPTYFESLKEKATYLSATSIGVALNNYVQNVTANSAADLQIKGAARLLLEIRKAVLTEQKVSYRLELLEATALLEAIIFRTAPKWQPKTVANLLDKINTLVMANAGTGAIELWEWNSIEERLKVPEATVPLGDLIAYSETAKSAVEWSTATIKANYQEVVNTYAAFEPKAYGFLDDKIRSSITLFLGESVSDLGQFIARESNLRNSVLTLADQSSFRGLNPGYAFGELVVVEGSTEELEVNSDKIYIFERPPADLKPVAGIATVSEGNLVSHVQLLARNLGIPNATLSDNNLKKLKEFNGEKVFYAVSNKGNIILKLAADMTLEEHALFAKKVRREEKIAVPIEKIRLDQTNVLNLRSVKATDSGKSCLAQSG